jgi:hypothetical protein
VQDVNGDGKVDVHDAKHALSRFQAFMATTAPSAVGFATGFMFGLR